MLLPRLMKSDDALSRDVFVHAKKVSPSSEELEELEALPSVISSLFLLHILHFSLFVRPLPSPPVFRADRLAAELQRMDLQRQESRPNFEKPGPEAAAELKRMADDDFEGSGLELSTSLPEDASVNAAGVPTYANLTGTKLFVFFFWFNFFNRTCCFWSRRTKELIRLDVHRISAITATATIGFLLFG